MTDSMDSSRGTRLERWYAWAKNNRLIAAVMFAVVVIGGVAGLAANIDTIRTFIEERFYNISPQIKKEYCDLLRPLVVELDRTKAALDRWDQKNLSLESETIREGNLKARAILREKAHLVHDSLRDDQNKLIFHYDKWLEEYDRVRVRKIGDPEQNFVFVYSFPSDSEKRFRVRMAAIEAQMAKFEALPLLGGTARCAS